MPLIRRRDYHKPARPSTQRQHYNYELVFYVYEGGPPQGWAAFCAHIGFPRPQDYPRPLARLSYTTLQENATRMRDLITKNLQATNVKVQLRDLGGANQNIMLTASFDAPRRIGAKLRAACKL